MGYQGESVKIQLGDFGLISDASQDRIPPSACIEANNVIFGNGVIQKAPGAIQWNPSVAMGSNGIVALHWWEPNTVTQRLVTVTAEGYIYKSRDRTPGTPINSSIASVLTPNCVFTEGGAETAGREKKLFLFTGGATKPYVLTGDGAAFALISAPNVDWTSAETYPKFGVVHRNRLWAFARQISYASNSGDHENFTSSYLSNPVYPGEGGELIGAYVYKGRLMAFKDGGFAYMLNDTDADSDNWYWSKISSNFGLSAPNAIAEVMDNLFAGNNAGTITDFKATQALGDVEAGDLVKQCGLVNYFRTQVGKTGLSIQHMLYYPERKWLLMTFRSGYATFNNAIFVFDFARDTVRAAPWIKGAPTCLALYRDINRIQRPMYGDTNGIVKMMDYEDRHEAEYSSYEGSFQTPHLDFGHINPALSATEKHFDFLAVHYVPEGNYNLSCDYFIDGRYIETLTFQMRQYLSPVLDQATLDTSRLAQANNETCKRKLRGTGRTISFRFYNSGLRESFQIAAYTVMFRPGGHKAQQV